MTIEDMIRRIVREELGNVATPKSMRVSLGLTAKELAARAGVSDDTISGIESGRTKPTLRVLTALSQTFPVPSEYINAVTRQTRSKTA